MYAHYAHAFIFSLIAVAVVLAPIVLFVLIRPVRPDAEKQTTYECGERAVGTPWVQFNIRYYIICLIFIIFEVEILLLFPWAVVYKAFTQGTEAVSGPQGIVPGAEHVGDTTGLVAFTAMFVFMVVLAVGLAYDWGKGYLEWQREMTESPEVSEEAA